MDMYIHWLEEDWANRGWYDDAFDSVRQLLKRKPSYVDFFVKKWLEADGDLEERRLLYPMILCGAPIKECLEFGVEHDDLTDGELRYVFDFWWLKKDSSYSPMSWDEYEQWLEKQKKLDGRT